MINNDSEISPRPTAPAQLARSIGFLLAWNAATSERQYADALKRIGLTPVKVGVLEILRHGALKQAQLSQRLNVFQPVMVPTINDLESAGFVERRPHPTDRRAVAVHILPAGTTRLELAERIGKEATDAFFSPISSAERTILHGLLARLARVTESAAGDTK
jgi:DNA-binding MarR family transcriptional regulator